VRVRAGGTVAGEVLAHGADAGREGSPDPGCAEERRVAGGAGEGAVADHGARRIAAHVQNRREIDVDPHGRQFGREDKAQTPGRGRSGAPEEGDGAGGRETGEARIREPAHPSPLVIDGDEGRRPAPSRGGLDLAAQLADLPGVSRVAREQHDTSHRPLPQPSGHAGRDRSSLEAHEQDRSRVGAPAGPEGPGPRRGQGGGRPGLARGERGACGGAAGARHARVRRKRQGRAASGAGVSEHGLSSSRATRAERPRL